VGTLALSDAGQALTDAHQRAQRSLVGKTLSRLATAWTGVDPDDPASWLDYVRTAEDLCSAAQDTSATAATRYLTRFRHAELTALGEPAERLAVPAARLSMPGDFETALASYGPPFVRQLVTSGMQLEGAMRLALAGQFGKAMGLILSPGRDVLADGIRNDRRCLGYRRVCSGGACSFCAMLATRGAVYKRDSFGTGTVKGVGRAEVHRSCQCSMEPVYSYSSQPTDTVQRFIAQWRESGGDLNQFRRLVEGRA
jgi:hypothetical protein